MPTPVTLFCARVEPRVGSEATDLYIYGQHEPGRLQATKFQITHDEVLAIATAPLAVVKPVRAAIRVYGDTTSGPGTDKPTMLVGDQGLFDQVLEAFPRLSDTGWLAPAHLACIRKLVGEGTPARLHFTLGGKLEGVFHAKAGYTMRPPKEA